MNQRKASEGPRTGYIYTRTLPHNTDKVYKSVYDIYLYRIPGTYKS